MPKNDDPSSLRMQFGARDAFLSGVTEFQKPIDPSLYIWWAKEGKPIAAFADQHPSLKERFVEIVREELASPFGFRIPDILSRMKREVRLAERAAQRKAKMEIWRKRLQAKKRSSNSN